MALSVETQKWLDDLKKEGNLSDEAFNAIKAGVEANPKADEFVKGSALRQSDYSRQMTAVQQAQKAVEDAQRELQAKEAEVNSYKGTLESWKTGADAKFNQAVKDAEAASNKATAALNRLRSVAVASGLDENEVLKDLDVTSNNPNPNPGGQPTLDTSKFLTSDQLKQQVAQAQREAALIDATIYDLAAEYRRLYGQEPPSGWAKSVVEGALSTKTTLEQYVTKEFKFDEKRGEASEKAIQARIDEAVKKKETELLSNQALAGQHPAGIPSGANSPVFKNENIAKPVPADRQSGGGVSAALAAHAAGKYRQN